MTIDQLKSQLETLTLPTNLSAYKAAQIASRFFDKEIRPQMIVNYLGKKYITGIKGADGKWQVNHASFTKFLERYSFRNLITIK